MTLRDEGYYEETWQGRLEIRLCRLRLWRRYTLPHAAAWWVAWHLPRRVALMALVRITSAATTGQWGDQSPDSVTYSQIYKRWEAGAGR